MRRILGSALIALPIVVFLIGMVIHKGWEYVVTMLAMTALWAGCFAGGMHLLSSKNKGRRQP